MTGQEKGDLLYRWLLNRGDHIGMFYFICSSSLEWRSKTMDWCWANERINIRSNGWCCRKRRRCPDLYVWELQKKSQL